MKKISLYWLTLISGIIYLLIGLFHTSMTSGRYSHILTLLTADNAVKSSYFFAVMGIALVFSGITAIYSSIYIKQKNKWAGNIIMIQNFFVCLIAVAAAFCHMGHVLTQLLIVLSSLNIMLVSFKYKTLLGEQTFNGSP